MAAAMTAITMDTKLFSALENFDSFTKKCENYLSVNNKTATDIKSYLKSLYNVTKNAEEKEGVSGGDALPELIVDNFDEEQIWQELELQNEARLDPLVGDVAGLVARKDKLLHIAADDEGSAEGGEEESDGLDGTDDSDGVDESDGDSNLELDEDLDGEEEEGDLEDDELDLGSESDEDLSPIKKKKIPKKPGKPSVVDDKFFKLSEMQEFLEREERENGPAESDDSSDESVDFFNDILSDNDGNDEDEDDEGDEDDDSNKVGNKMHYSDFFDAPDEVDAKGKAKAEVSKTNGKVTAEADSDEEDEDEDEAADFGDELEDEGSEEEVDEEEARNQGDKKKVRWNLDGSGSESDSDESSSSKSKTPKKSDPKSSYEARQERLQAKIKQLEEEALSEKPWQLKGEILGTSRPENALLEEALEFDSTTRPAPVMTEEVTQRLEDIIKQRIKDRAWDDVERKQKPVETPSEYKKKLVLDQEKSKLSLAQVYEQEYLKKAAEADPEASADQPEEVPKEHQEIKILVDSLFRKLDALSNFHFTPKQVAPEVKIVTNIPAINMEEVAPVATSDATLLAPEEVKAKPKGDIISKAERTDTDKKRERRQKKQKQRMISREKEKREATVAKMNPGLGNRYSKQTAMKALEKVTKESNVNLIENTKPGRAVKSSTSFFSQLQDEVKSSIKGVTQNNKKRKNEPHQLSAKRLKL